MRGIRLNNAAEAAALEEARGDAEGTRDKGQLKTGGGAGRAPTAAEMSALAQFLPTSMVAEAVVRD